MKLIIKTIIIAFITLTCSGLQAQVTIGLGEEPMPGALLQLKEIANAPVGGMNSTKGLMLPRVNLVGVSEPKIGDATDFTSEENIHTGLWVYNLTDNTIVGLPNYEPDLAKQLCPGPYVWDGENWIRLLGPCNVLSYGGKILCDHNIQEINLGVCQSIERPGSFQLIAYGDAVITIKNGDVLGEDKDKRFQIVAVKKNSGAGDTDYYTVTKDNSPLDINVVIKGTAGSSDERVRIDIDLSDKITGGEGITIEGCPYSYINVTSNVLLTDPTTILFTSGKDGLSFGFQDYEDQSSNSFPQVPAFMVKSMVDDPNQEVRPWGIPGIAYTDVVFNNNITGFTGVSEAYWPFKVHFQPDRSEIRVKNPESADKSKEPNFKLIVNDGQYLSKANLKDIYGCGYKTFITDNNMTTDGSNIWWGDFITMKPIDQAPRFVGGGGSETFYSSEPYALRKEVGLEQVVDGNTVSTVKFDVRQIHYGLVCTDMDGNLYSHGANTVIPDYGFEANNYEFKFKMRSNLKWRVASFKVGTNLGVQVPFISNINVNDFGPEEDAYGDVREMTITIKFDKDVMQSEIAGGLQFVRVFLELYDAKIINSNGGAGDQTVIFEIHP